MWVAAAVLILGGLWSVPSLVRIWQGKPNPIERGWALRGTRLGNPTFALRFVRSAPLITFSGLLFFTGGVATILVEPHLPSHHDHSAGAVAIIVIAVVVVLMTVMGAIGVFLGIAVRWTGRPRRFVPPHLRDVGRLPPSA